MSTIPRTHRNLLANAVANPTLGNLPTIVQPDLEDHRRKIEDFERMVERMGGEDRSLSCIHVAGMAALREQFQIRVAGNAWRETGLPFFFGAATGLAAVLEEMSGIWCHWRRPAHEVDNGILLLGMVDLVGVFLDMILQEVPPEEFVPNMHPDSIASKISDVINATWNAHFDVMAQEGVHASDESMVMMGYLDELTKTVGERNPVEGLGVIGAMLAILGLTPLDLYGWLCGKHSLNMFRQDNGYQTGEYFEQWGIDTDTGVLAKLLRIARDSGYKTVSTTEGNFVYEELREAYLKSFE